MASSVKHSQLSADAIREANEMILNDEARWSRLELLCLLTLTSLSQSAAAQQMRAETADSQEQVSPTDRSNNFGGTLSAPASAIAVGAIGNALAKATMPTTAGVIPVYASADCI